MLYGEHERKNTSSLSQLYRKLFQNEILLDRSESFVQNEAKRRYHDIIKNMAWISPTMNQLLEPKTNNISKHYIDSVTLFNYKLFKSKL